ncbi:hypothetical protein [Planococcus sp. MB-3u-03]|nr:hypothetical protein [Planococcus sp. MB-3u-03]
MIHADANRQLPRKQVCVGWRFPKATAMRCARISSLIDSIKAIRHPIST